VLSTLPYMIWYMVQAEVQKPYIAQVSLEQSSAL
jgi:hypothetical protein